MKQKQLLLIALLWCAAPATFAASPLWWSETMPHADRGSRHSHGGPVEIRRGVFHKNLWLREGDGPADAQYLHDYAGNKLLLVNVKGEVKELEGGDVHGSY